jgi:hypothetical protein
MLFFYLMKQMFGKFKFIKNGYQQKAAKAKTHSQTATVNKGNGGIFRALAEGICVWTERRRSVNL